jgi:lysozyme
MQINDAGLKIVMESETLQLSAYVCPAGKLTIGYGHTGDVKAGDKITEHEAEAILTVDLQRFEMAVARLAPTANENEFSAMVSLAFNIGVEAFSRSTLLALFNQGKKLGASAQFAKWCHGGGKVLPGLVKRRQLEADLFLRPLVRA